MRIWIVPFLAGIVSCGSSTTNQPTPPVNPAPQSEVPPPPPKPATASDRENYTQRLTDIYLDNSIRISVRASGKDKTTVTMTYGLMDEVFIHHFFKTKSTEAMRALGFKRLVFTSGYPSNYSWHYDLVKDDWFPESKAR